MASEKGSQDHKRWTVKSVEALTDGNAKWGKLHRDPEHRDLHVLVRGESRSYLFRFHLQRKEYRISLGSVRKVTLREAREKARALRVLVDKGINPTQPTTLARQPGPGTTFEGDARAYFEHKHREWDDAHASIWIRSLERHVFPKIGARDTASLTASDIQAAIEPIWIKAHETAIRVHGRIKSVIDYAMDLDDHDRFQAGNPADRALRRLPRGVGKDATPHRALPWQDAPALYQKLAATGDRRAAPLRFMLLCCCPRTAEVLGAKWGEVDGDTFMVPADRMKSGTARKVAMPRAAIDLLASIRSPNAKPRDFIFPANRRGKTVDGRFTPFAGHAHQNAMSELLQEMNVPSTVHGLRATFRSWVSEHAKSIIDHDAAERALDHQIGNRVHRSYDRSDLFEARRDLAERWSAFLASA